MFFHVSLTLCRYTTIAGKVLDKLLPIFEHAGQARQFPLWSLNVLSAIVWEGCASLARLQDVESMVKGSVCIRCSYDV